MTRATTSAPKVPEGASKHDCNLMMRRLLLERFQLKAHVENREVAVYELRVGKGGPKIAPVSPDSKAILTEANLHQEHPDMPIPSPDLLQGGVLRTFERGHAWIVISKQPLQRFTDSLYSTVERPVFDRTGLPGIYSFVLSWTPGRPSADLGAEIGPSVFTAIQQQLGLKLESAKANIDILVVESALKVPTEN